MMNAQESMFFFCSLKMFTNKAVFEIFVLNVYFHCVKIDEEFSLIGYFRKYRTELKVHERVGRYWKNLTDK